MQPYEMNTEDTVHMKHGRGGGTLSLNYITCIRVKEKVTLKLLFGSTGDINSVLVLLLSCLNIEWF